MSGACSCGHDNAAHEVIWHGPDHTEYCLGAGERHYPHDHPPDREPTEAEMMGCQECVNGGTPICTCREYDGLLPEPDDG